MSSDPATEKSSLMPAPPPLNALTGLPIPSPAAVDPAEVHAPPSLDALAPTTVHPPYSPVEDVTSPVESRNAPAAAPFMLVPSPPVATAATAAVRPSPLLVAALLERDLPGHPRLSLLQHRLRPPLLLAPLRRPLPPPVQLDGGCRPSSPRLPRRAARRGFPLPLPLPLPLPYLSAHRRPLPQVPPPWTPVSRGLSIQRWRPPRPCRLRRPLHLPRPLQRWSVPLLCLSLMHFGPRDAAGCLWMVQSLLRSSPS